jgi:lysophospholipase L1-like esterase
MGVGASTVFGQESFDSTGWRRPLREKLVRAGNPVNMVGTQRIGKMIDNDVEAFAGARIDMILEHVQTAIPKLKPNLIILYAGSNDNYQNATLTELYKRYYALAQYMFSASPKATIVMGTLMPTTEKKLWGGEDRIADCNEQLKRVYQVLKREGKPITLVEMNDADGVQIENLGWDHMHPTRAGYQIMARKFFEGVVEADARGFLRAPEPLDGIVDDGNSAPGRVDEAGKKALAEEKAKKEEAERLEEEAVLKMIEELKAHPWDGTPPKQIKNSPPPEADKPGPVPPPPPSPPPPPATNKEQAPVPPATPAT